MQLLGNLKLAKIISVIRIAVIILLILSLHLLLRMPYFNQPLQIDEGLYAYIAQGLSYDKLPYRDTFDHKPPGIYYIYASAFYFFGEQTLSLRIFTALYSCLTICAVFAVTTILFSVNVALISALLFAVFANGVFIEGPWSNTEVFLVLPVILSFLFFIIGKRNKYWPYYLLSGFFAGIAVMIKQVALLNFLVIFVMHLYDKEKGKRYLNFPFLLIGFLLPIMAFFLYFYSYGVAEDFCHQVFFLNISYINQSFFGPISGLISTPSSRLLNVLREGFLLYLFGFVAMIIIFVKNRQEDKIILVFWALSSFVAIFASRHLFGHYFIQLLPPLAILAAYAISQLYRSFSFKVGLILVGLITMGFFMRVYFVSPADISSHYFHSDNEMDVELAQFIRLNTDSKDKILVWGFRPQIYFLSGRKYPGKYVSLPVHFPKHLNQAYAEAEEIVGKQMVKIVALMMPPSKRLSLLIKRNYKAIVPIKSNGRPLKLHFGLYKLKYSVLGRNH